MLAEKVVEWTQQWEQQRIQKGLEQGRQQGEAALLMRLLERKFGTLDSVTRERIMAADADTLLHWVDNVLNANTLAQVFE